MLRPGFGLVCRLIMLTPSTTRRLAPGTTLSTRPRLPRSLPVTTRTLSFLRIGVAKRDMATKSSQHFRGERNDLHEAALAQFAGNRTEHAGPDRLALIVDEHGGVPVEPDVAAVAAPLLLHRANDHGLHDLTFLHVGLGRRFLHRGGDHITQPRVAAGRTANRIDDGDLARAGVVGDVQDPEHMNHVAMPPPPDARPSCAPSVCGGSSVSSRRSPRCRPAWLRSSRRGP